MSAPAYVIVLALEAAPRIYVDALHADEMARLVDWIDSHPELRDLLDRAGALRDAKRAA